MYNDSGTESSNLTPGTATRIFLTHSLAKHALGKTFQNVKKIKGRLANLQFLKIINPAQSQKNLKLEYKLSHLMMINLKYHLK